ncbi:DUF4259 domain-containing protein [Curtobacterium sp. MCLR17_043]|uniref:DUF4259 domain-containing protein n=1 Tax=Curtobacterium sp. MCLR17_043 TaxID=2175627 RepID=UPI000DA00FE6|nr:DUF4259 domain-containing protein [Curtobacterium sp. MCLR17_043]PYY47739.1 DUF4259 domain-containing protein [Curtobacterium sp. MCLR17_043]
MGTWSAEPFGNDTAADFAWELDGQKRWGVVRAALEQATKAGPDMGSDIAVTAIAAAEVVAHGLGRPTQTDAYTESVEAFVGRARKPNRRLTEQARRPVTAAADPAGELAELWAESDGAEWDEAIARLVARLGAD